MDHAFGQTDPFLVGIEEELLVVDPDTHLLTPRVDDLLGVLAAPAGRAGHEAYAAEIELRSSPCRTAGQAAEQLTQLRARASPVGLALMGAGLHPAGRWGEAPLVAECALHVHVSMPDPESAIRAYNGLRHHLPVLVALSANSPWWFGEDSGLASARHAHVLAYPRRGVPNPLRDYEHYLETLSSVMEAGELGDYTWVWWDVRPHPRLGTVEVREMDAQSRIVDVAGLGALVQALACHESQSEGGQPMPTEAIAESCFRAARDGIQATIFDGRALRPLPEVARSTMELARPYARDLGGEAALDGLGELLEGGGGAQRQRAAHRRGGMPALLEQLVAETMGPPGP
jgi:carboxylate-amine ligase